MNTIEDRSTRENECDNEKPNFAFLTEGKTWKHEIFLDFAPETNDEALTSIRDSEIRSE